MLVAFGVILLMGIIVSDHLSAVRKSEPADMGGLAPLTAAGLTNQEQDTTGQRTSPLPMPGEVNTVNQPQENQGPGINPNNGAIKAPTIATGPGSTPPPDTFVLTPVNGPATNRDVIGRPTLNLESDGIIPGAPTEKIHTVAKGDSLSSISKQYYNDPNQWKKIADANKLTKNSQLKLGMKLSIPAATPAATPTGKPATGDKSPSTQPATQPSTNATPIISSNDAPATDNQKFMTYTVKNGDTLAGIAAKTLGSKNKWQIILDANKETLKKPEALKAGMVLKVPRGSAA
jgi:nucleoid-associated protein YgaU